MFRKIDLGKRLKYCVEMKVENHLAVFGMDALTNSINLLVHLGTMMISFLTSARDSERHSAGMPRTDTSDFSQTLVGLTRQFLRVPSRRDT